jgi:hypothetical protein
MIYTRASGDVVFLCPTVAISVANDWWIELAWLNFAIGARRTQ